MGINRDKPDYWKVDIQASVDLYNRWFMKFAPEAFRQAREKVTARVEDMLNVTLDFGHVTADLVLRYSQTIE